MLIRSKAPLRIGFAGGGTDISPYCDQFGGAVLNATIDLFAHCSLEPRNDGAVSFSSCDQKENLFFCAQPELSLEGPLQLHMGVYNTVVRKFTNGEPLCFNMHTYSDAPSGSGLGSSSTMVVAMLKAYMEWLNLPLGDYDIASLAYEIEREYLGLSGGKQDQYAATFGGFNFIEFYDNHRVIVNPLRVKNWIKNEVESSLILYYTGRSRSSAAIIDDQIKNTKDRDQDCIDGMHELKQHAVQMKNALLCGDFGALATSLNRGWESKKKTSKAISNEEIEAVYEGIMTNGGKAAKISGAGGGGFFTIICDPIRRYGLVEMLKGLKRGYVITPQFYERGAQSWTLYR